MSLDMFLDETALLPTKPAQWFRVEDGFTTTMQITEFTYFDLDRIFRYNSGTGAYTLLVQGTDFGLTGNADSPLITIGVALGPGEAIVAYPLNSSAINVVGVLNDESTVVDVLFLKASTGFSYQNVLVTSWDRSTGSAFFSNDEGVTFVSGLGSGFSGLVTNALIGHTVVHNGSVVGLVTANTATGVTLDTAYSGAASSAQILATSNAGFSLSETGPFEPVLVIPSITVASGVIPVWFSRDAVLTVDGVKTNRKEVVKVFSRETAV